METVIDQNGMDLRVKSKEVTRNEAGKCMDHDDAAVDTSTNKVKEATYQRRKSICESNSKITISNVTQSTPQQINSKVRVSEMDKANQHPTKTIATAQNAKRVEKGRDNDWRILNCSDHNIQKTESDFAEIIAQLIHERIYENDKLVENLNVEVRDVFYGPNQPKISIKDYLERMIYYLTGLAQHEKESGHDSEVKNDLAIRYIVIMLIYIERINRLSTVIVCSKNIHRLIITGITVAAKILDDLQPKNTYFAQLGGVPLTELNELEREFCALLEFKLYVDPETFNRTYESIIYRELDDYSHSKLFSRVRVGSAAAA